jgi:hypothetical protein
MRTYARTLTQHTHIRARPRSLTTTHARTHTDQCMHEHTCARARAHTRSERMAAALHARTNAHACARCIKSRAVRGVLARCMGVRVRSPCSSTAQADCLTRRSVRSCRTPPTRRATLRRTEIIPRGTSSRTRASPWSDSPCSSVPCTAPCRPLWVQPRDCAFPNSGLQVPAQMWASPGAGVGDSRRRYGWRVQPLNFSAPCDPSISEQKLTIVINDQNDGHLPLLSAREPAACSRAHMP